MGRPGGAGAAAPSSCVACGNAGHTMETCRRLTAYEPAQRKQIAETWQKNRMDLEKFKRVRSVVMSASAGIQAANSSSRHTRRRLWDLGANRNVTDKRCATNIQDEETVVLGVGEKMRLKKVGRVNVLPGHVPLKTLVTENSEMDILAPLVLINEEEINASLSLSMEIPHAVCHEHELLLFSNVNGEKKLLHRIREGEVIEGLFIDQQPAICHAQHGPIAMLAASTSGGGSILAAIAAEAHVRALIAEAAMDNGTRNWTTDEYQLMHAACVQMLTPPEGDDDYESQSDASIDIVEAEQPNDANTGGSGSATCQEAFYKLHSDRLAHASVSTMRLIKQHDAIPGIPWGEIVFPPG